MKVFLRWFRLLLSYCLLTFFIICAFRSDTVIYLFYQSKGQLSILTNTVSFNEYISRPATTEKERENLQLIKEVKRYSVDSLNYDETENFNTIYDQKGNPILWVITVSEAYEMKAYEWKFPVVGQVSYKGYFRKDLADKAYNHFRSRGYDVELRSVSAWSTLGWFKDPVLSTMLTRKKGSICNLLFHELFHATYYAKSSVEFNENIANFIAHKATLRFLAKDTAALNEYLFSYNDNIRYRNFILRQGEMLRKQYPHIQNDPRKPVLKMKLLNSVVDSLKTFPVRDTAVFEGRKRRILQDKNAYFIGFRQYDSMQDSLDKVFNNIYGGNLKKMVQDLKQNKPYY